MVRDDLYITVPSFFKCPISLDVMKSPVSLSTGVTYDRESIQRWLDDGNDTCPATMQILQSKDFVPNLTLQRLIQIWSDSVHHLRVDSAEPLTKPALTILSRSQVIDLIGRLNRKPYESSFFLDSLPKIACFARESGENRRFLAAESTGFGSTVVDYFGDYSRSIDSLEMALRALDMIRGEIEDPAKLASSMLKNNQNLHDRDCLRSLVLVLQNGSVESRIGSARVLESMAFDVESKLRISENEELLSELLKLISPEKDLSLIEAGLSCLIALSPPRRAKAKIVRLGAVKSVKKCLSKPNSSNSVAEKALRLLETAASVREGWEEIAGDRECVESVVERLMKVSSAATEHAAAVLWCVCCVHGNNAAREAAAAANGAAKVLLLMQADCSPAVRQMAAELLRAFRLSGSKLASSFVSCYDTKTTHIMPF